MLIGCQMRVRCESPDNLGRHDLNAQEAPRARLGGK